VRQHWNGEALEGPDSGIRFNSRIGRFVKSYSRFLPWSDRMIYFQAQAYWIKANWLLADMGNREAERIALGCTEFVLSQQQPEGFWEYPNPEWKGRIATVEGCYGALGLLSTYERVRKQSLLHGAEKWYDFACHEIGFQGSEGDLAINYFYQKHGAKVPNNSTLALKMFAHLFGATGNHKFLSPCPGMVNWLGRVQLHTGELPYSLEGPRARVHFLCYQYNAFELLDLLDYYRITADEHIVPIVKKLAGYLAGAVTPSGSVRFSCRRNQPEVLYYAAAVAAALSESAFHKVAPYADFASRAYEWVLEQQRKDGGFQFFSRGNYGILSDRRSYPRNLAMVLYHLLLRYQRFNKVEQPSQQQPIRAGVA
jgi:hypothetical protein